MLDSRALKWQFWLLWVVASGVAGAITALVARAAAYSVGYGVGQAGGTVLGEAALGIVALGGFMAAIAMAQWLVMLREVPWAGRWVLANVASGALSGAVMLSLMAGLSSLVGQAAAAIIGVVTGLAVFGTTQWIVLRRPVSWAVRIAVASVIALAAAATLGAGVIGSLTGGEIGAGAGFGAVYGAVTGCAVVIYGGKAGAPTAMAQQITT